MIDALQRMEQIFSDVTDLILAELRKGVAPWVKPWRDSPAGIVIGGHAHPLASWPRNICAPKSPFGILNGMLLLGHKLKGQYTTDFGVDDQRLKALGISKDKIKGEPCKIARYFLDENSDFAGPNRLVYNIEQIVDYEKTLGLSVLGQIPLPKVKCKTSAKSFHHLGVTLHDNGTQACYYWKRDIIEMPHRASFSNKEEEYWATLWHEVIHWTGHTSRLNRFGGAERDEYAFEELIAELGAAYMCAYVGIECKGMYSQHASYIASWLSGFRLKKTAFYNAAKGAMRATDFIEGKIREAKRRSRKSRQ